MTALHATYRITPKPDGHDRLFVDLPTPVVVSRHQCPFCRRFTRADAAQVRDHMTRCWQNPALRCCKTCVHHQDGSHPEDVEYLYSIDSTVSDDARFYEPPRVVRFRITKKTPKRIYYLRREDDLRTETGYVNRQQIEADGEVYNHGAGGWWAPDFHLHLAPPVIDEQVAPDLAALKAAMAAAHPDCGGTDEAFITARTAYEKARAAAERATP